MKKKLLALVFGVVLANMAFSAAVSWQAGTFSDDYAGGTFYLVVTQTSVTAGAIAGYIEANGLGYSGTDFTAIANTAIQGSSGAYYTAGESSNLAVGTYSAFMVVLSQDQSNYLLSTVETITITDGTLQGASYDMGETWADWSGAQGFAAASGTVGGNTPSGPGGNDPGVPEPTALALLALGVAGLALRRRA